MNTVQELRSKTVEYIPLIHKIVEDWTFAQNQYSDYKVIHDSTSVSVGELDFYPVRFDKALRQADFMHQFYHSKLIGIKELRNVYYCGCSGLIISESGSPIIASSRFKGTHFIPHSLYADESSFRDYQTALSSPVIRLIDKPVARVVNSDCISNYGHWHLQTLPTINFLKKLDMLSGVHLLLPPLRPWQRDSLDYWFGDSLNIMEVSKEVVLCRNLFHLSAPDRYDEAKFNPNQFDLFLDRFSSPARTDGSKVYLTRLDSSRRRVSNELELIEVLKSLGFKSYTMGALNYRDQINVMKDAKVIVGPRSSSIVNHLFSGPDAKVCELQCLAALPGMHASHMRHSAVIGGKAYFAHITSRAAKRPLPDAPNTWGWKADPIDIAKYIRGLID
jgi:hypothetical protein